MKYFGPVLVGSLLSLAASSPLSVEQSPAANQSFGALSEMQYPHRWIRYDLDVPINTDSSVSAVSVVGKRTPVTVCERILTAVTNCVVIAGGLKGLATAISSGIKDLSNQHSCGQFSGAYNDVAYRYTSTGTHCDTTAEQATIGGAIENHIKTTDGGKVCGMECVNLSHGGTWNGYLLIGPRNSFDNSMYCGPTLSFNQCDSGGKNDLN